MSQEITAIKFEDVSFSYNGVTVLDKVNIRLHKNDFIWIVGPNGGGKTTLIKLILGLLRPKTGAIEILGVDPD